MSFISKHISLCEYDERHERVNTLTHAIGFALALFGLFLVIKRISSFSTLDLKLGMLVYALSNVLLYGASMIYHALRPSDAKRFFRILDHSNIYILIAGTYCPLLMYIGSTKTIYINIAMWIIVAIGIISTLLFWNRLRIIHVVLYVIMGWLCVFFYNDIFPSLPEGLFKYILAGGIVYTLGLFFYGFKKIPYYHAIWHLFTLLGSLSFFVGIYLYI
ncbi:MAG TPA: hemolysin III family protein [Candidatus Ornithospirochaeta avicola]|uniref:Hemolysin III family protein n=1 Tax=Candidatus Ornithospirochaeta avicola TaxID=2840896 RepID=A0A9D1TMW2_9SPIO|nr:hemolysin III family protein [Candidatus Ornithospirochaeta avicola]